MAKLHRCIKCNKSFPSSWNHKQRCSNHKKSESDEPIDKEKIIGDILNKVDQRVKDRAPTSLVKKLELKMVDAGSKKNLVYPLKKKRMNQTLTSNLIQRKMNHLKSLIMRYRIVGKNLKKISKSYT